MSTPLVGFLLGDVSPEHLDPFRRVASALSTRDGEELVGSAVEEGLEGMSKLKLPPTFERLSEVISYDREAGSFKWLIRPRTSKARDIGDPAGYIDKDGYVVLTVDCGRILGHRAAWHFVYGSPPDGQIDHINGVRNDNRIANLRMASSAQNAWNRNTPSQSKLGLRGVSKVGNTERFQASIRVAGKVLHLGTFSSSGAAAVAYDQAARVHHGEFATVNFPLEGSP